MKGQRKAWRGGKVREFVSDTVLVGSCGRHLNIEWWLGHGLLLTVLWAANGRLCPGLARRPRDFFKHQGRMRVLEGKDPGETSI